MSANQEERGFIYLALKSVTVASRPVLFEPYSVAFADRPNEPIYGFAQGAVAINLAEPILMRVWDAREGMKYQAELERKVAEWLASYGRLDCFRRIARHAL